MLEVCFRNTVESLCHRRLNRLNRVEPISFKLPFHLQKQEKFRWSQVWAVGGVRQHCQQLPHNNRTTAWCVLMVKFPILRNGWLHMRYSILQAYQYLHVKCCIYGHSSRHKLFVNNVMSVEKNNKHGFDFGF